VAPLVFNWAEGGRTPPLSLERITELGFSLVIYPLATLLAATTAVRQVLQTIRTDGTPLAAMDTLPTFEEFTDLIGLPEVQAVLFDLGVSSLQLDVDERGFSYARDAPLDMRMDPTTGPSAADVLNTYAPGELVRVLRDHGEERQAKRIVEAVVRARRRAPLRTSAELVALLEQALPAAARRTGGNPAKRTFQALRIEVNGELDAIAGAIPDAVDALALGGRIVVMSYQSLEDRIVKRVLGARSRTTAPPDMPVLRPEDEPELALLTRGAEKADESEVAANPRAASVRLRAAERVREAA